MFGDTNKDPEDDEYDSFDESEIFDDELEDNFEPVGSCEECCTNLYEEDDPELCDQCLWAATGGDVPDEDDEEFFCLDF